jgi:hypothetical protein
MNLNAATWIKILHVEFAYAGADKSVIDDVNYSLAVLIMSIYITIGCCF